jgi:hypothetical protein
LIVDQSMSVPDSFTTPVLFLIFNRPETTKQVWEVIQSVRPKHLYVAADGPRSTRPEDIEKCKQARAIVQPDWDCELKILYREENLGCRNAVSQAITWFFNEVEEGIILEDDCLPDPTFFNFCSVLLEKYRNEPSIMHIGGCNFQYGKKRGEGSYYFSKYNHIWGWATWRRAWESYDMDMKDYPLLKNQKTWREVFFNEYEEKKWRPKFQSVYDNKYDTWDYQWTFAIWKSKGLAVTPQVNLISNIGFDKNATHTISKNNLSSLKTMQIGEWRWTDTIAINQDADKYTFLKFQCTTLLFKLKFYLFEILALLRKV